MDDLFCQSKKEETIDKRTANYLIGHENPEQLKRKRDTYTENLRKKAREGYFERRRKEDTPAEAESDEEEMEDIKKYKKRTDLNKEETLKELPGVLLGLEQGDRSNKHAAIKRLRKLLTSDAYTPIQEVVDSGSLPLLLRYAANNEDQEIQVSFSLILSLKLCVV
jgi:hypothetical protein